MTYRKKLIEVALPLSSISTASAIEKSVPRRGHPQGIHLWWARRPLAAARGVLFAQIVDDPAGWPEEYPDDSSQQAERRRLFALLEDLCKWENTSNEEVLYAARYEIARNLARRQKSCDQAQTAIDLKLMCRERISDMSLRSYLSKNGPRVRDPFCGGGSIPLEGQRLGLEALATDLNPIPVLINRALIEIPGRFANRPPVGPVPSDAQQCVTSPVWRGSEGLAADILRYGQITWSIAWKQLSHLYPLVHLPPENGGGQATPVGWLWARTVESPDPAFHGVHVPLVSSFWITKSKGSECYVLPVVSEGGWYFEVHKGQPKEPKVISAGTKTSRGANFRCILSGSPIEPEYLKAQGRNKGLGVRLMAVAAEAGGTRHYISPSLEMEVAASTASPPIIPDAPLPGDLRAFWTPNYGLQTYGDLYTPRQLVALSTLADTIKKLHNTVKKDCLRAGWFDDDQHVSEGGTGATAYADAICTYLSLSLGRTADYNSSICTWNVIGRSVRSTFARHALPMTWDFYESNPFGRRTGGWLSCIEWVVQAVERLPGIPACRAEQGDATIARYTDRDCICTDPPYYDNIGYADLSDYFYLWHRQALCNIHPDLFQTLLTPKDQELVASPYRHGSSEMANDHFRTGMAATLTMMASVPSDFPICIYYAFKQTETTSDGQHSTGWESFLEGAMEAGLSIVGTWPIRTERDARNIGIGKNALASSIVLVCRRRQHGATVVSRRYFRRELRTELPIALAALGKANIAPVDMTQATIGPGMGVFSRHLKVLEPDDSRMTVRAALQLINEVIDELRGEEEGELDPETRFAITWFEAHGFSRGPFGEAEVLAKARAVAVNGVAEAGICRSGGGRVQLIPRSDLPIGWDPIKDARPTVWEAAQQLIKRLDEQGEGAAASLMGRIESTPSLGPKLESARLLAYRLYDICERRGWADEAGAYNRLVVAWPDLIRLSADAPPPVGTQTEIF
jgi:putative DNA methylase